MSYVLVSDVPASWASYRALAGDVAGNPGTGLLLHIAGPTDEGFRIIEVWESEAAWLADAADHGVALDPIEAAMQSRTVVRDLHPVHLVVGEAWAGRVRDDWIAVGPGDHHDQPTSKSVHEPVMGQHRERSDR